MQLCAPPRKKSKKKTKTKIKLIHNCALVTIRDSLTFRDKITLGRLTCR